MPGTSGAPAGYAADMEERLRVPGTHVNQHIMQHRIAALKNASTPPPHTGPTPSVTTEVKEWTVLDREMPPLARELATQFAGSVSFTVNGTKVTLDGTGQWARFCTPHTMLVEFLRFGLRLTGTKLGCGEGGCGACTVLIQWPQEGADRSTVANACLRPVLSLDGAHVTTTEGLGSGSKGYHAIHSAMAEHDGTQCGFCSPGMVMSMYGLLQSAANDKGAPPTEHEVEQRLQGNLCRCTGYRPIYSALRTFCKADAHSAALQAAPCMAHTAGTGATATCCGGRDPAPPRATMFASDSTPLWFNPSSRQQLLDLVGTYAGKVPLRLLMGNTAAGVVKYYPPAPIDDPSVYIHLAGVAELRECSVEAGGGALLVGSAVTLSQLIRALEAQIPSSGEEQHESESEEEEAEGWQVVAQPPQRQQDTERQEPAPCVNAKPLVDHLMKVAHWQVRDVASWCGNMMLHKTHKDFPSDVVLLMSACGATLSVLRAGDSQPRTVGFMEFAEAEYDAAEVVLSMRLPLLRGDDVCFDTFKVMGRHANSHPLVNAAFCLHLVPVATSRGRYGRRQQQRRSLQQRTVASATVLVGNMQPGLRRCTKTETALQGAALSLDGLKSLLPALSEECMPSAPSVEDPPFVVALPAYRQSLATGLFYKFWLRSLQRVGAQLPSELLSAASPPLRALSAGEQHFTVDEGEAPVGKPVHKIEGQAQCSGEAQFTADVPLPAGTLFAAVVLTTRASGKLTGIDASQALKVPGAVAVVSAEDVKAVGASNSLATTGYEIFVSDKVNAVGQVAALLCAETQSAAERAAKLVALSYADEDEHKSEAETEAASLSDSQHQEDSSSSSQGQEEQDDKADEREQQQQQLQPADGRTASSSIKTTGQKHFYMETNRSLVVPGEGIDLAVHCSTQSIAVLKLQIALALRCWTSRITVTNTRIGGAYGGKAFLPVPIAAAACVAALRLKRPVLLELDRNADMSALGGRPPVSADFSASWGSGTDSDSLKLTALSVTTQVDTGFFAEFQPYPYTTLGAYQVSGAKFKDNMYTTPTALNTIMRAPGHLQATLFTEAAMEMVARTSGVPPTAVQEANMDPAVAATWQEMKRIAGWDDLQAQVKAFNQGSRWRKRGAYCMPVKYSVSTSAFGETCLLAVAADGSVNIDHSGVEMGQGINTKVVQAVAMRLGQPFGARPDMEMLSVQVPKSTAHFSTTGCTPTWGSGTSETCVYAALVACDKLNDRLKRYAKPGNTWQEVVAAASKASADLNATGNHIVALDGGDYDVYCAAATCVEIDVLTGECEVLSSEIVYDAGTSLNPAVDIGQIEGSFVQSVGFCLSEEQVHGKDSRLITNGTWEYKPPSALDIPVKMNVTLTKGTNKASAAVLGSKATGEPAQMLGLTPFFAAKQAIYAAREEAGQSGYFRMDVPASPERVQQACLVKLTPGAQQ